MAFQNPSGSFLHAAQYASLLLEVVNHLFPGQKWFALSADQRRIVDTETRELLVYARWIVDSKEFAGYFSQAQVGVEMATPDTVLGQPLPSPERPGEYR